MTLIGESTAERNLGERQRRAKQAFGLLDAVAQ